MVASIYFLGTGTGLAATKQLRASGGIVIKTANHQFHLDPGPGALTQAAKAELNLRATTAVLVSHAHLTHANDTNILIDAMTYFGQDNKGVLLANHTALHGHEKISLVIDQHRLGAVEKFIDVKPDQRIGVDEIEIRVLKTIHSDPHAVGFKFYTPDFILTYTGDTDYSKEILEQYAKSDILLLNVPFPGNQKCDNNLNTEKAIKIIQAVKPKLAIITHFSHKMLEVDPLFEARHIQKNTQVQTLAAKDGLILKPDSYSAHLRQKTLNIFGAKSHVDEQVITQNSQQESKKQPAQQQEAIEKGEEEDDQEYEKE